MQMPNQKDWCRENKKILNVYNGILVI
ncbi:uncharacterized protein METZ01_LOCUS202767 [marine metagenome]|uniref:Uncharacterized protein n=1 Tax=marine metagenome TaxID=408172 RepID=A0A382EIZ8_9ZZZZ